MDTRKYVSLLEDCKNSGKLLMCEYCGHETVSTRDLTICSNCESIITTTKPMLEKKDPALLKELQAIIDDTNAMNYSPVIASYDKIILERKEPQFMYAAALANIRYSNHEITLINYNKPGFMEENAVHRDKAAKLISSAKKLLTKSIKLTKDEMIQQNNSLNLTYNLFLMELKLGKAKSANATMQKLKELGNEYLYNYAVMIFEANREKYDAVIKVADTFMKKDRFCTNAFYYLSLALFKKGRLNDAKSILESIKDVIKTESMEALSFEVNYQLST